MALLEKIFCRAPTMTARKSGVTPSHAVRGASCWLKRRSPKKSPPVHAMTEGVTRAAKPQPRVLKIQRPRSIMKSVTEPVAALKAGNWGT